MSDIGKRIKSLRIKEGLTQSELAYLVGYKSKTSINKIELGLSDLTQSKILDFCNALKTTPENLIGWSKPKREVLRIPVYGKIAAGVPIEAIEDIIDYEEVWADEFSDGEYIALQIKGDSMEPRMKSGDVVLIRKQPDIENGEVAAVMVNGTDATIKRVMKSSNGITLIPLNPLYGKREYTNYEIETLPVTIIGKAVELRGKL